MKNILFLFLALLTISCTPTSTKRVGAGPMPSEPGKCYAKCLSTTIPVQHPQELLPIYIGSNPGEVTLRTKKIEVKSTTPAKWVKKKTKVKCISADPDDCLIWCLENEPSTFKEITYLADTTQTKDFVMKDVGLGTRQEGGSIWQEVICAEDIDVALVEDLRLALVNNGATFLPLTGIFDAETKKALIAFQKKKNLCIGQLTLETLEFLGL